ncbi:MAG: MinD/ParA family protein, partial [Clostridia bacterium]|nr:MinD/ParA family protein [Clostridia bacterium]
AEEFLKLDDFDTILIDTGTGISMNIMSFIAFSQEILIVTTPEPTSMTDAYGLLKVISELNLDRKVNVIVNRVSNKETALFTYERLKNTVEKFLNIKLEYLGYILDDMRVKNAVMDRKPLIQEYPDSIASKCLMAINDKMIETNNQEIKLCTMSQVYNRLIKVFG